MTCLNKTCFKCGESKPLSHFYRHPRMADGHVNKCKDCNKLDVRANRKIKVDYYRAYDNARACLPKRVKQRAEVSSSYVARNPERSRACLKLRRAVTAGKIVRPEACWYCGRVCKPHGHHFDYSMPLAVTWLCAPCHKACHHITDALSASP